MAINVLMELVIAAAAVAKGFSDYLASLVLSLDQAGPHLLTHWNGKFTLQSPGAHGVMLTVDLVAMAAVVIITLLLVIGVKVCGGLTPTSLSATRVGHPVPVTQLSHLDVTASHHMVDAALSGTPSNCAGMLHATAATCLTVYIQGAGHLLSTHHTGILPHIHHAHCHSACWCTTSEV